MPCFMCARQYDLKHFERIPVEYRCNFIYKDYRVGLTFSDCCQSVFHWHNETLNIWTRLCGVFIFILLLPVTLFTWDGHDHIELILCLIYVLSAIFMLGSSVTMHTFSCMSLYALNLTAKIDHTGIGVQILGSYGIIGYCSMKCYPEVLTMHVWLAVFSTLVVIYLVLFTNIVSGNGRENRRLILFIGYAISLTGGLPHSVYIHGWTGVAPVYWRIAFMCAIYIGGAVIYFFQIPERWFPGKWNDFSSHTIWHCFVLVAALYHYVTCYVLVHYRLFECTEKKR